MLEVFVCDARRAGQRGGCSNKRVRSKSVNRREVNCRVHGAECRMQNAGSGQRIADSGKQRSQIKTGERRGIGGTGPSLVPSPPPSVD